MFAGCETLNPREGGTPGNSWWGVPPGSPNPDPTSDQKMSFSTPVFRLDLSSRLRPGSLQIPQTFKGGGLM